jgi:hypothetical protein
MQFLQFIFIISVIVPTRKVAHLDIFKGNCHNIDYCDILSKSLTKTYEAFCIELET